MTYLTFDLTHTVFSSLIRLECHTILLMKLFALAYRIERSSVFMTFHDTCVLGIVGGVRPPPPQKKNT